MPSKSKRPGLVLNEPLLSLTNGFLPGMAALLVTFTITGLTAFFFGKHEFTSESYAHWDSGHYLAIAEHGYDLARCDWDDPSDEQDAWCGNAGWLPGYPLGIRFISNLGLSAPLAGAVLSHVSLFLVYAILFGSASRLESREAASWVIALAVFFPGAIYYQAVFPVSLFLLFAIGSLVALADRQAFTSGILGFCAAFTYSTGFLLAPVLALGALIRFGDPLRPRVISALVTASLTLAGFLAVLCWHQVSLGHWDAFFLVQQKYGHGLHFPWQTWRAAVNGGLTFKTEASALQLQTMFCGGAMVLITAWSALRWRGLRYLEVLTVFYAIVFWVFPLAMGPGVSLTRQESLLLPLVLFGMRCPLQARWLVLVSMALLSNRTTLLFLDGALR